MFYNFDKIKKFFKLTSEAITPEVPEIAKYCWNTCNRLMYQDGNQLHIELEVPFYQPEYSHVSLSPDNISFELWVKESEPKQGSLADYHRRTLPFPCPVNHKKYHVTYTSGWLKVTIQIEAETNVATATPLLNTTRMYKVVSDAKNSEIPWQVLSNVAAAH
ncbi:MAG: HSP20 family molecular chaperone IbpA [Candidatus Azotimanducaceae bacterium]|jgi:HSP20 family molecular chaperone IbpA